MEKTVHQQNEHISTCEPWSYKIRKARWSRDHGLSWRAGRHLKNGNLLFPPLILTENKCFSSLCQATPLSFDRADWIFRMHISYLRLRVHAVCSMHTGIDNGRHLGGLNELYNRQRHSLTNLCTYLCTNLCTNLCNKLLALWCYLICIDLKFDLFAQENLKPRQPVEQKCKYECIISIKLAV